MQGDNNNNKKNNSTRITKLYVAFIVLSIVIMIIAAAVTYGYNPKEIHVSFGEKIENQKNTTGNKIEIGGVDLSKIPDDEVIEDILNDEIPNVCDDCEDEDHLDCLYEYEINKILVQNPPHQDHLFIELITGSEKYVVVIDLSNNNKVLSSEGDIDKKACIDSEVYLFEGNDALDSEYASVGEK